MNIGKFFEREILYIIKGIIISDGNNMRLSRTARIIAGQVNKQFWKASNIKTDSFVKSPFGCINSSERMALKVQPKFMLAQMDAIPKLIKGMG